MRYVPVLKDGDSYVPVCSRCRAVARNTFRTDGRSFAYTGPRPARLGALICLNCDQTLSEADLAEAVAYHETRPWPGERLWNDLWNFYKALNASDRRRVDACTRFWELRNVLGAQLVVEYQRPLSPDELGGVENIVAAMHSILEKP